MAWEFKSLSEDQLNNSKTHIRNALIIRYRKVYNGGIKRIFHHLIRNDLPGDKLDKELLNSQEYYYHDLCLYDVLLKFLCVYHIRS